MARTAAFRALRRILRRARPATRVGQGPSRRAVLAGLGALPLVGACGDNLPGEGDSSVAIVGGGIAGLTAAHFLESAGVHAQIFESSQRIGGRIWTERSLGDGQLAELGGELVDSDHLVVPALARTFGLELDDLVAATADLRQDVVLFDGALQSEAALASAFAPVAAKIEQAIAKAAADPSYFAQVDAMSLAQWLEVESGLPPSSTLRQLLEVAYLQEYGLEVTEQSAWNLLNLIDARTPDPFRLYGASDERYHVHTGTDSLTTAMAARLGDRIVLGHRLESVEALGSEYALTFATADGSKTIRALHVVYALPFTRLRAVELDNAGLSAQKRAAITELGYGTHGKLLLQFTDRHWETAHDAAGRAITDVGALQKIWAASRGQPGSRGVLANCPGGLRGLALGDGTAEDQAQQVLPWIDAVFPGTAAKYVAGSAIRMHWPSYEHARGSVACYRVGQWSQFFATEGAREGNQHFCGEHCSEDYQGTMEGGAETGALVAGEVLDDLGVPLPPILAGLLAIITERPRASYHAGFGARMTIDQLRRVRGR